MTISDLLKQSEFYANLCIKLADDNFNNNLLFVELKKLLKNPQISLFDVKSWKDLNKNILSAAGAENFHCTGKYIYFSPNNKSNDGLITTSPNLSKIEEYENDEKYKIVFEGKLKGYNSIPDLWIFVTKRVFKGFTPEIFQDITLTKEMSHYYSLLKVINELLYFNNINDLIEFFEKYKENLKKIRKISGDNPKYLGGGADGKAYDIGGNMVLKLFTDNYSFESAIKAMETLHIDEKAGRTEARIYDAGIIGSYQGQELYFLIIEKMKTLNPSTKEYIKSLITIIIRGMSLNKKDLLLLREKYKNTKLDDTDYGIIKTITEKIVDYTISSKDDIEGIINIVKKNFDLKENWFDLFVEEIIMKYISGRTDLHMGNLGVTNFGELRYFDPAYSSGGSQINY